MPAKDFAKNGTAQAALASIITRTRSTRVSVDPVAKLPARPSNRHSRPIRIAYFTKAAIAMLSAEQILDAISAATGVPETFKGYPAGTRANSSWRDEAASSSVLQAFSKPVRDVSCEVRGERGSVVAANAATS